MKKEREEWTCFLSTEPVDAIEFTYDQGSDSIRFNFKVKNSYRRISYKREKKDKVLSKVPLDPNFLYLNDHANLASYDSIVAIDTNTKSTVSVTGIAFMSWVDSEIYQYEVPFCIAYTELTEPREKIGWLAGMEELSRKGYFAKSRKTLLIVDAYLDQIDLINSRELAIHEGYYLPPGFDLAYASADVGAEYLPNILLKMADKTSSQVMKYMSENNITHTGISVNSRFYKTYCLIYGKQP